MSKHTTDPDDALSGVTDQSGAALTVHSSTPVNASEEEALLIRTGLQQDDDPRKETADKLAEQLARPKHGTA